MTASINLTYKFYSTGEFEGQESRSGQGIDPVHRLFSRFLGSVRQLGMDGQSLIKGAVDLRMLYIPAANPDQEQRTVECLLTFSFKLPKETSSEEEAESKKELVKFCESVLTFTFRQHNFTIERIDAPALLPKKFSYIIEILRPIDTSGSQNKIVPEPFKLALGARKLANLFVRYGKAIGYCVTVDLHGLSQDERALVVQAGIQAQDPLSKLGEHFALPLSPEESDTIDSIVKPVCKLRILAETEPSSFFISELLECISPNFPRTLTCSSISKDPEESARFTSEALALESVSVLADSPIQFTPTMQPLMRKVYRSLGIDEIANIAPFPRQPIPGIIHKRYRSFIPPISDLSPEGILIGTVRTEASVDANDVRVPFKDRLRHMYVLGKTGTGKSSFLASMVIQDITAGHGVVVLDPHGDLCDDVISAVPEACLDKLVLIDPVFSTSYPKCSLNVLDIAEGSSSGGFAQAKDYWTGELTSMFLSLYGSEVFGPRIQEYFQAACLTLMDPEVRGTLVDVPRLFTDATFRKKCRDTISDPYAAEFWSVFDVTGGHDRQEMIPYFSSKFSPLVRSYLLRSFIGQSSGLKMEQYLDAGSAVLIRLSKGALGEMQMRLVGMLLLAKIKAIVFSRQAQEQSERTPVIFYADEFQNFVFEGFQTLLSEARKYGLGLILAHQYLAQMTQNRFQLYGSSNSSGLLDAILGNIGSIALFRLGAQDAEQVVPHIGEPVQPRDLINLESYEYMARVLNKGVLSAPMTVSAYRHELLNYATGRDELKARIDFIMERFK